MTVFCQRCTPLMSITRLCLVDCRWRKFIDLIKSKYGKLWLTFYMTKNTEGPRMGLTKSRKARDRGTDIDEDVQRRRPQQDQRGCVPPRCSPPGLPIIWFLGVIWFLVSI